MFRVSRLVEKKGRIGEVELTHFTRTKEGIYLHVSTCLPYRRLLRLARCVVVRFVFRAMRRVDFDFEGRVEGSPGRIRISLFIYFFWAREKIRSFKVSLLLMRLDLSAILDSCARSRRSLDPSLPPSLRNAHSRLKRPLRHPFHAVRAKSVLLQIRKLQICVGCCQSRERIVVPGGDSPGVLGWLHGG